MTHIFKHIFANGETAMAVSDPEERFAFLVVRRPESEVNQREFEDWRALAHWDSELLAFEARYAEYKTLINSISV